MDFELNATEKYDEAMGFGYALMTDTYVVPRRAEQANTVEVTKLIRQYSVPA